MDSPTKFPFLVSVDPRAFETFVTATFSKTFVSFSPSPLSVPHSYSYPLEDDVPCTPYSCFNFPDRMSLPQSHFVVYAPRRPVVDIPPFFLRSWKRLHLLPTLESDEPDSFSFFISNFPCSYPSSTPYLCYSSIPNVFYSEPVTSPFSQPISDSFLFLMNNETFPLSPMPFPRPSALHLKSPFPPPRYMTCSPSTPHRFPRPPPPTVFLVNTQASP